MNDFTKRVSVLFSVLFALGAVCACDDTTNAVKNEAHKANQELERTAAEAKQDVDRAAADAKQEIERVAIEADQKVREAGAKAEQTAKRTAQGLERTVDSIDKSVAEEIRRDETRPAEKTER